jgi:tetratricopeptide (TPR) repeat protein
MVRSVESVASLLKMHLSLDINATSAEALRLNYEGNVHLRNGDVDQAIECYNIALEMGDKEQEGVLLVMRGTAFLQRCYASRLRYKDIMVMAQGVLPTVEGISSTIGFVFVKYEIKFFA